MRQVELATSLLPTSKDSVFQCVRTLTEYLFNLIEHYTIQSFHYLPITQDMLSQTLF